ncbi:hypothetical protein ElyMa_006341200 [Elysia marginata]|uniref:Uncharacterized protein n=1 Tax=Elysia marginata TaxID=1093978 RepID=A0AAV4HK91_9GAST|nr:hypothetical protein ElyMa_006341200 [Elysia marginata]
MDAVTTGFSACANLSYTPGSHKLQLALRELWTDHSFTVTVLKAENSGVTFSYQDENVPDEFLLIDVEQNDKRLFVIGEDAYVCLTLDISTKTITFVNNLVPEMIIPAPRYKDITSFRVGHFVTIHEVHILYNQQVGTTNNSPNNGG